MKILYLASLLFLWLPYPAAGNVTISAEDLEGSIPPPTSAELENIALLMYTGTTIDEYTSVLVSDAASLVDKLNSSRPTTFYLFGWTESPESKSVETIIGAYLRREDHNVVLVNWEHFAAQSYPVAAVDAKYVGGRIATAMNEMVAAGLNSSTIHVVGHSMGAQIAGFVGRSADFTVPRITGLDPAGPGFLVLLEDLSSGDAEFVDIIHTDAAVYGTTASKGDVNYYPNGGTRIQSGCTRIFRPLSDGDFCSHHRSWYYYAESLLDEDAFVGCACNSYAGFMLGRCSGETAVMGYAIPKTTSGNYFLQTNSKSPFGKKEAGAKFESVLVVG